MSKQLFIVRNSNDIYKWSVQIFLMYQNKHACSARSVLLSEVNNLILMLMTAGSRTQKKGESAQLEIKGNIWKFIDLVTISVSSAIPKSLAYVRYPLTSKETHIKRN